MIIAFLLFTGCEKDFLTQLPLDQLTDESYWTSESNVRTFAYGFYTDYFPGYGASYSGGSYYSRQLLNDDFAPAAPPQFLANVPTSGGGWSFSNIRRENIFIDRVKNVDMSEEAINHWTGIGRFFRGLEYATLVNQYGDVPYFDYPLTEDDPQLYKARDPRTLVMDNVLADFNFAAENVRVDDATTGPAGTIVNKFVVLAFMSRIFLFEGTWQKYHGGNTAKANEYLQAAKWAANEVITKGGFSLGSSYRGLFSSVNLSGNKEMILYRVYEDGLLMHAIMSYNANASQSGPSKNLIESYLCSDGLPILLSPLYNGDKSISDVMSNRDPRIKETFVSELRLDGVVGNFSTSGYAAHKFLNEALKDDNSATLNLNTTDAPIIRYGEVLLNYAEACVELGQMNQSDLDISINKLRDRSGIKIPHLQIVGGNPAVNSVIYDDPARDSDVSSLIWEIRRERRIEMVFEGLRLDDLRRWKKLDYSDTQGKIDINRGAWIVKADHPKTNAKIDGTTEGYIIPSVTQRIFNDEKVYLNPLPLDQITLYQDQGFELTQNPGWD